MASREDSPIWLDAEETIRTLFHDQADNDWLRLEQRMLIPTPSKAAAENFNIKECCEIRAKLQEGFSHIFEHSHVSTFWEDLVFKLKRAGGIHPVATRKRQNEEQLVTSMIYPTMKKVVDSISIIPGKCTNGLNAQRPEGVVSSHLVIQDEIKMGNSSGQSPAVDAMIQISDGNDCKVLIPVEVKVEIEEKHLYQVAAYVTKVSTAKELEKKVVIGIIIDKEFFKLVFSPYYFFDETKGEPVPLPIVYVSPLIQWKETSPQTLLSIVPAALLVIACTCYFQLERIECDTKDIDSQVLDVARKLFKTRHEVKPILSADKITFDDLLQFSKQQQNEIKILKDKLDALEEKIHPKQNGTDN